MPIVPCVLIALDKDCVTARDEKSGDDVAAARLRHAAQGHGERPPACIRSPRPLTASATLSSDGLVQGPGG